MSRDQRVSDNWALLYAQELALSKKEPLVTVFNLVPEFLGATLRQYRFMLKGLEELQEKLARLNIDFYLLTGEPETEVPRFCQKIGAGALVTDFSPLRINVKWKTGVAGKIAVPCFEVDAHNIVPCWAASPKQEYAAYTLEAEDKED
jgi:deoxyribodipyrimidine photo-lyase